MEVGLVTVVTDIPLTPGAWNSIVAQCHTNTIFQTHEWFDAWWRSFGSKHRCYFISVRQGDQIIAFAPMMITVSSMGLRRLEFIGAGNSDYLDFCYPQDRPEALDAICDFLCRRSADWDVMRLGNLPMQSMTWQRLSGLARTHKFQYLCETTVACPTLVIAGHSDEVREIVDKYSVRRKVNWFKKLGELQTRHLSEPAATHAHLEHFFNQHTQRWQRAGFHSQFDDPAQREFFKRLTDTLGSRGWLRFSTVSVGEQMLAYHFGFDYGGRLTWYKPAFNPRYADHSPGLVLIQALIQEALRTGRDEFDLTVGAEPFKLRFSNLVRSNAYVSVFHGRGRYTVAMALHYLRALARSIVRPVRGKWRALRAGSRSMKQLKQ